MKNLFVLLLLTVLTVKGFAQTISQYYDKRNFAEVIKFAKDENKLSGNELYMVGYAYFVQENDAKAIAFYDKAIKKGLDEAYVYYYKALALRYSKQYKEAVKTFDIAIARDPQNQEYVSEKAFLYYYKEEYDEALKLFEAAATMPNDFQAPHYMVPHIYHLKGNYQKALTGYYDALKNISKENKYYTTTLADIGKLEYTVTKNYIKSAKAYADIVNLKPAEYDIYSKLIKSYNAAGIYKRADSVFLVLKAAYERNELSKYYTEFGSTAIDEYEYNGQNMTVYRYFKEPKEMLDVSYKVYRLNKAGDKVERTFMVEKTIKFDDKGASHLLCERDKSTNTHKTYAYGWAGDEIPLADLKKAVELVLDGKMNPAASSRSGK